MKRLVLNEGSQRNFVTTASRYAAYIGGIGSGKTFAGIARGLKFSQQPKVPGTLYGPRGLCAAVSYPVLMDVVLPQFHEMVEGTNLVKEYIRSEKKAILRNGAEILFRSLDDFNKIRGVELSWFFIDEGRHLSKGAWDVLVGRLRQNGYAHGGWVCSTPNGFDWMWQLFHEDSAFKLEAAEWYGAPTHENELHLPEEYIRDLEASYEGKFYEQEVEGKFVGILSGAVFPHWNPLVHAQKVEYDPELPLYSAWDFGIGDLGVVLFAQIAHRQKQLSAGVIEWVPELRFIGAIEAQDWGAEEWAAAYHEWLDIHVDGRRPDASWGDPAGKQRSQASGTSVIDALAAHGVTVYPAPKRPPDYAIFILDNFMAGDRVTADKDMCARLSAAFSSHKWNTDDQGVRIGTRPVHDWTSHFADAARYLATGELSHYARRTSRPHVAPPGMGTVGHVASQLLAKPEEWLGAGPPNIEWQPTAVPAP